MKVELCLVVLIAVLATSDAILLKKLIAFKAGLGIGAGLGAIKGGLVGKALSSGGGNGYASNYNHGGHAQVYKVLSGHGGGHSSDGWSSGGGRSSGGWSSGGSSGEHGGWSSSGGHDVGGVKIIKVISSGHSGWSNGGSSGW